MKTICLLGGSGFVGSHLTPRLVQAGWRVRIPTRHPQRHKDLQILPGVSLLPLDIFNPEQLGAVVTGCDAVVNLVGILNESGHDGSGFQRVHQGLPELLVTACDNHGVSRVIHLSALNASARDGSSHYLRSKGRGEDVLRRAETLQLTRLRPSVIFGHGDSFLTRFAKLLALTPCCFPLACADAKFAPVWVGDLCEAVVRSLQRPDSVGEAYDLCGPHVYSLRQLVEYTAQLLGVPRRVIPLGDGLSRLQAQILEYWPGKPFSLDNYASLQIDSVCETSQFGELGIQPRSLESIAPTYLGPSGMHSPYDSLRRRARHDPLV